MKHLVTFALIAACGFLGAFGLHQRADRLRAEGAAQLWRAQADSAAAVAEHALNALEVVQTQENALIELERAKKDSAVARADRMERENRDAAARARRAAAAAKTEEDRVRAALATNSAGLGAFGHYVAAVALQTSALEERAQAAETRGDLLARGLAAADSVAASLARQRDAALAAVEPLQVALAARTAEAESWRRAAAPGELLGFDVPPLPAFLGGVALGLAAAVAVLR